MKRILTPILIFIAFSLNAQTAKQSLDLSNLINYLQIKEDRICSGKVPIDADVKALVTQIYNFEQKKLVAQKNQNLTLTGQVSGQYVTESFSVLRGSDIFLQKDLMVLASGDVHIDGNIYGGRVVGNANGQNLFIKTSGKIYLNGNIRLSDGGNGDAVNEVLATTNTAKQYASSLQSAHQTMAAIKYQTLSFEGGTGGSVILIAQEIVFSGNIQAGNGGQGYQGGKGGDGGSHGLFAGSVSFVGNKTFKAGNGGAGGKGGFTKCTGGDGGAGGNALLIVPCGTADGSLGGSFFDQTGGAGGTGGAGNAGGNATNFVLATNGCDGGNGGTGGSGTSTISGGAGNGGAGGAGGTGGKGGDGRGTGTNAERSSGSGGNGGNGGLGGIGQGGNGTDVTGCNDGGNGGMGTGGAGGTAGAGGTGGLASGNGTNGNGGNNGTGGTGGIGIGGKAGSATGCGRTAGSVGIGVGGGAGAALTSAPAAGTGGNGGSLGGTGNAGSPGSFNNGSSGTGGTPCPLGAICTISCTCQTVLAVEFTNFDAQAKGKTVAVQWETATEEKSKDFNIERSVDGKNFKNIGVVSAKGYSNTPQYYNFIDESPLSKALYRVKVMDMNGQPTFTKVVTVVTNQKTAKLKVYPNPVGTEGYLNIETVSEIRNITITNSLGQVVMTAQTAKINISQLAKGLYNVSVQTNEETLTDKFFKQ